MIKERSSLKVINQIQHLARIHFNPSSKLNLIQEIFYLQICRLITLKGSFYQIIARLIYYLLLVIKEIKILKVFQVKVMNLFKNQASMNIATVC